MPKSKKDSSQETASPPSSPPPSPEPKKKRVRNEKSEEARQAMLKRLEVGRKKAFEVRLQNKELRIQEKKEHDEKVEKVNTFLKNEDIFEKKYKCQFDKITDKLEYVENHLKEEKEYKERKRAAAVRSEVKAQEERPATPTYIPLTPSSKKKSETDVFKQAVSLPNYRTMKFGKGIY